MLKSPSLLAESDRDRLSRLATWMVEDQAAGAELELSDWRREADCPAEAWYLLASSLARRGEAEHALRVLREAQAHGRLTADMLMLRITLFLHAGLSAAAGDAIRQLIQGFGETASVCRWIEAIAPQGAGASPNAQPGLRLSPVEVAADPRAMRLGQQLAQQPQLIATLVAAQKIEPDPARIALLRAGLDQIGELADAETQAAVHIAQAELALLAGDVTGARRAARAGLAIDPYLVRPALILAELPDEASETAGLSVTRTLHAVAERYPDYPDVQAALIRREQREGRPDLALARLARWLERSPNHPIATALAQELAA